MYDQQVDFLNSRGAVCGYADFDVSVSQRGVQCAAVMAAQGDHAHVAVMGRFNGGDDIGRSAAGADGQQDVALVTQRPDLLGEYLLVGIVVGDGG